MAKESVNILKDKIDIVDLLAQLNAALSEEWLYDPARGAVQRLSFAHVRRKQFPGRLQRPLPGVYLFCQINYLHSL